MIAQGLPSSRRRHSKTLSAVYDWAVWKCFHGVVIRAHILTVARVCHMAGIVEVRACIFPPICNGQTLHPDNHNARWRKKLWKSVLVFLYWCYFHCGPSSEVLSWEVVPCGYSRVVCRNSRLKFMSTMLLWSSDSVLQNAGVVLGLAYAQTRTLVTPILIHSMWNSGVVVLLTVLRVRGLAMLHE